MRNLDLLIQKYMIKPDRIIKKICAPLNDLLGIPTFCYLRIESDGRFGTLSNRPKENEFYYSEKMYLSHPLLIHPTLIRPGHSWISVAFTSSDTKKLLTRHMIETLPDLLIMVQCRESAVEGFIFAPTESTSKVIADYYTKLELMSAFARHFKRETKTLIQNMMNEGFNIKEERKEAFFKIDPAFPLSNKDPKAMKFLKAISPLSKRERQCLDLFKQGHSAQTTAAILGLSQRTVEHYFDNIKNKLGCSSKSELLTY